jgi:hypothetical protein
MKTTRTPSFTQFKGTSPSLPALCGLGIWLASLGLLAQAATPPAPTSVNEPAMPLAQISPKKTDTPSLRFAGRTPFSADEFWKKILLLLREQEGWPRRERSGEYYEFNSGIRPTDAGERSN